LGSTVVNDTISYNSGILKIAKHRFGRSLLY